MVEAEALLDAQLKQLNRPVLTRGGRISRADADRHVKAQFKSFDKQRKLTRQKEADVALAELRKTETALPKSTKKKR